MLASLAKIAVTGRDIYSVSPPSGADGAGDAASASHGQSALD
jgi:hypothetical protein